MPKDELVIQLAKLFGGIIIVYLLWKISIK